MTKHAQALISVAAAPGIKIRDLADRIGVNERTAYRLVVDLEQAGYLTRHRLAHQNFYEVHPELPLRQPLEADRTAGDLLAVFLLPADRQSPLS
ncbi:MAG: helix-turn-helix domain-containing protein [Actinomycetota bacterium]|nr:helix-turn-helix domain-containing protein [Actinomycetota bacterium]